MNTYKKIDGQWLIACPQQYQPGEAVPVALRNGTTKTERIGDYAGAIEGRDGPLFLYRPLPAPAPAKLAVGDLGGILALFRKAREHLKFPAIVLSVPGLADGVRINVAGQRAKFPGTLNVLAGARDEASEFGRDFYGRIDLDGHFAPSRKIAPDAITMLTARLRAFAADPATVAGEHGRLTGRCCFCNIALTDERSTAVGYGPVCADHFGLPWGARPEAVGQRPEVVS